jgi:hypothetical protein
MRVSRIVNGSRKEGEQKRRDARMLVLVKKGSLPYIPAVMSWLSTKLGKPSRQITAADVKSLLST